MFTTNRDAVLEAIEKLGAHHCTYTHGDRWADTCDCKYGARNIDHQGEESSGCPELRCLKLALTHMTNEQWEALLKGDFQRVRSHYHLVHGQFLKQLQERNGELEKELAEAKQSFAWLHAKEGKAGSLAVELEKAREAAFKTGWKAGTKHAVEQIQTALNGVTP